MNELSSAIKSSPFHIFSTVIIKTQLRYDLFPENPYVISLRICLQKVYKFLETRKQLGKRTHFIFEKRGKKEDKELELEFRRIIAGHNDFGLPFELFDIHFSDKKLILLACKLLTLRLVQ